MYISKEEQNNANAFLKYYELYSIRERLKLIAGYPVN